MEIQRRDTNGQLNGSDATSPSEKVKENSDSFRLFRRGEEQGREMVIEVDIRVLGNV